METTSKKYVVVSQGIKIAEFNNKIEAEKFVELSNEEYYKYEQQCLDNGECPADTEMFLYEEGEQYA